MRTNAKKEFLEFINNHKEMELHSCEIIVPNKGLKTLEGGFSKKDFKNFCAEIDFNYGMKKNKILYGVIFFDKGYADRYTKDKNGQILETDCWILHEYASPPFASDKFYLKIAQILRKKASAYSKFTEDIAEDLALHFGNEDIRFNQNNFINACKYKF